MLSYQHMYHAGGLADVHKHVLLARALTYLTRNPAPLIYVETHSGRGRYFLNSPPAQKTGEAAAGIERLLAEHLIASKEPFLRVLKAIRQGNKRIYGGSPLLAATLLRPQDRLWLWELHPREYGWLQRLFANDRRVSVCHGDGMEGALEKLPPVSSDLGTGLVLVDPSYEVKAEYEGLPVFVRRLRTRWPQAAGILWYPMLPARRHEAMRATLEAEHPDIRVNEMIWGLPSKQQGLFGSALAYWNLDGAHMDMPSFQAPSIGKGTSV